MALRPFAPADSARSVCPSLAAPRLHCTKTCTVRAPGYSYTRNFYKDSSSLNSSSNYVRHNEGINAFFSKIFVTKRPCSRRTGFLRCATIDEIEAEKSVVEKDAKDRMEKTIETLRANFNAVRTGRANPSMLDRVEVEYYGSPVSLKSIAQISTPDGSTLLVQPYDKSSLKTIEKAIVNSDIGLMPNNDGEVIRLTIPQLTSERRKELSKVVSKLAEEAKVAVRNIRRDAIKVYEKLEKEKKLSEDNVKDLSSDLQKVTDEYMKKIEAIQKQKEKIQSPPVVGTNESELVRENDLQKEKGPVVGTNESELVRENDLQKEKGWGLSNCFPLEAQVRSGSLDGDRKVNLI